MPERRARWERHEDDARHKVLTRAFRRAATTEQVYDLVVDEAAGLVGATAASVVLLDHTGEWVEVVAIRGYGPDARERFGRFRSDADLPLAEAIRTQRAVVVAGQRELAARSDVIRPGMVPAEREVTISLPVQVGDHVIGAIGLSFESGTDLDEEALRLLTELSDECGRALERTMAVAAEAARLQQRMDAAGSRLAFVSAATRELARSLDRDHVLDTLTQLVVPRFADWASVLLPEGDELVAATLVHRDLLQGDLRARAGRFRCAVDSSTPSCVVFRTGEPMVARGVDADVRARMAAYPDLRDRLAKTRTRLIVPITAHGRTLGVLTLADTGQATLDEDDLTVAVELASRAGTALDHAERYAAERDMIEVLQRAVLPSELPEHGGLSLTARYLPATASAKVGGDWYDAFRLRDGRIGLCVGDVVGHGIEAAACMGQLRNALRVYALDGGASSDVVTALNRYAIDTATTDFATLVYAVYEPRSGSLEWTNAGHPSMLCRRSTGVEELAGGHGLPVGITIERDYSSSSTTLDPGDLILVFTDGLVESRERPLSHGLKRLEEDLEATRGRSLDDVADRLLAGVSSTQRNDDVCILALEHTGTPD